MNRDLGMTERFSRELFSLRPDSCVEVRCFGATINFRRNKVERSDNAKSVVSGWFTSWDNLCSACTKIDGVSAYMTVNPMSVHGRQPKLMNKYGYLKSGEGCCDKDVLRIDWVIVDIDPDTGDEKRRENSTDEELGRCIRLAERVVDGEGLGRNSVTGISGNGTFILVRTDGVENSPEGRSLVHGFIKKLSSEYNDEHAKIDKLSYIPSRMIGIPGSIKYRCPTSTEERPWRRVEIIRPAHEC